MFKEEGLTPGDILRKFLLESKQISSIPLDVVWRMLHSMNQARLEARWSKKGHRLDDYLKGREGDSLLIPFECDICVFRKLRKTEPTNKSPMDKLLLAAIRRMNLDTFGVQLRPQ